MESNDSNTTISISSYLASDENNSALIPLSLPTQIIAGIFISILILLAVSGNALTIISFLRDTKLSAVYDFYIFNLAVADFVVAFLSFPLYATYTLKGSTWIFGRTFCKIWGVIDYTCCLESVLIMVILSADRLLLITYGPFYTTKVTKKKAYIVSASSWLFAFIVYGPSIIGWDTWVGHSTLTDVKCSVEFAYNFEFTTSTAVLEFVIPFLTLAGLNLLIYMKIREKIKRRYSVSIVVRTSIAVENLPESMSSESMENSSRECNEIRDEIRRNSDPFSTITVNTAASNKEPNAGEGTLSAEIRDAPQDTNNTNKIDRRANKRKSSISNRRKDLKAAHFLAVLVLVFFVCWAPYTITSIFVSFCGDSCVNTTAYVLLSWILYARAAINPFLYAKHSARYRYNFKKYLSCLKERLTHSESNTG